MRRLRTALGAVVAALSLALAAACSSGGSAQAGGGPTSGVTITMWTRAGTQSQTQALIDAYNASHSNHVVLTVYPNEQYPAKIASAAGAHALPDIFTSDVVFAPNYVSQGLWADVTDQFDALPFKNDVVPSFIKAGTSNGRLYAVPHALDLSVLYYNKALYRQAGLDPSKPPTTLAQYAAQARTVAKLGGQIHGSYEGGNCGGCVEFTVWPSIWADGGQVMNSGGTQSYIDSPQAQAVFQIYRGMFADGTMAPGAKQEDGTTWLGALQSGDIGIAPGPFSWYPLLLQKGLDMGVAPIPGVNGGSSTFIGGDVAGISSTSSHEAAAWDFLSWTLGDQAQVNVIAKDHEVIARTDLAQNQYALADPNVVTVNGLLAKGQTPYALNFNATYNDPQSPWTTTLRGALFGPDLTQALSSGQTAITASLQQQ
ncbi:sugar ABC transporter substrate-binding protein [Actinospica durhamensis]|uniref:Sugar ABC transporter substrate-binding protein n=1 Tax=Actinospica durhamensis TaxID=1508375 RepID=A0A941ERD9_9ACTN|nr:sugar ABC transporter substrate-binding protein [Actinospica durhamensis]MBR7835716.1 sugar ABC transporter substrate-binding protein [Actinospica durhamensis]